MNRLTSVFATLFIGLLLTSTVIGISVQPSTSSKSTSQNETFVKQVGGTVYAVAQQGDYAYIGAGKNLTVLDIQDPTNPQLVGQTKQLDQTIYSLTVSGTIALAPQKKGLRIFDISNPTNPQLIDTYQLPSTYFGDVVISGTLAFVPEKPSSVDVPTAGGLRILDISDPLNINQVAIFGEGDGVEAVALDGNYAYLAYHEYDGVSHSSYKPRIVILDISTINSPTEIYRAIHGTEDIAIYGDYLYSIDNGLKIYNVSTPSTPIFISSINNLSYAKVFVFGDTLYVTYDSTRLDIYDLTDPANPSNKRTYSVTGATYINSLVANGNTAYLAYTIAGFRIIDVQSTISEIGKYSTFGYPLDALKNSGYIYVLDIFNDLKILNMSDPLNPEAVAIYETFLTSTSMQLAGQDLFFTSWYRFDILDVTNPISPTFTANYNTSERIEELIIQGDYAYIGRNDHGTGSLEIVSIADPANPTQEATIGTNGRVYKGGAIDGSFFYLSEGSSDSQFHAIDISDPENPQIVKSLPFSGQIGTVAIIGNYAYLAHTGVGIQMINISNPLNPIVEGVYAIPDAINFEYWVKAVDGQLYATTLLIDSSYAQHILDISNPTSPAKVGEFNHFDTSQMALIEGVEVNGYNYYPSRLEGLLIYQCHDCIVLDKHVYLPLIIKN